MTVPLNPETASAAPLLAVHGLKKYFPVKSGWFAPARYVHAVDGVGFSIRAGTTLGLVGESGCGKTTVARVLAGLYAPDTGRVLYDGADVAHLSPAARRSFRRGVQMVFQDPFDSLNPRRSIFHILSQPLTNFDLCPRRELRQRVVALLDMVGLSPGAAFADRYAHQLSGGQRQRIGIARALSVDPRLVIADEPVASLDISIRAQILKLLRRIQRDRQLAFLFITHDLGVARAVCDEVAVMYLGEIVEQAGADQLFERPLHPYTRALIAATPLADPVKARARRRVLLRGEVPSALDPPPGCRFHLRCPHAEARCRIEKPDWRTLRPGHGVACHFAGEIP